MWTGNQKIGGLFVLKYTIYMLVRRMKATIFRRMAITVVRMVAKGRVPDLARLMCHGEKTQSEIYNAEVFSKRVCIHILWKSM